MKKMLALLLLALVSSQAIAQPDKKHPRGLKPTPRHILAAAPRHHPKLTAASIPTSYFRLPKKMTVWGNDQYGDCVSAESAFNRALAGIYISDAEVIRWARANGFLDGADLNEVIQAQQKRGFEQDGNIYGNGPGRVINYADANSMKQAIFEAGTDKGGISIGISSSMLSSDAGNVNGWFKIGKTNDNSEDHCVSICGYGSAAEFIVAMNAAYGLSLTLPSGWNPSTQGVVLYTWATIGFVETSSFVGMTGEAWIRSPSTIITGTGVPTPDEVYVSGAPIPPPVPVPPTPTPTPGGIPTITLSQPSAAGEFEMVPKGTTAAVADVATATNNLAKLLTPVGPTPAPGTLNQRVDAIESKMGTLDTSLNRLADSVIQLQKLIQGGKQ